MPESSQQVTAFFAVMPRRKTVESKSIDEEVRQPSLLRFLTDIAVQLAVYDGNFITGEGVPGSLTSNWF